MAFKSKAQRAKFAELVKQGKMKQAIFDEWNEDTDNKKLPERVGPKTNEIQEVQEVKRVRVLRARK